MLIICLLIVSYGWCYDVQVGQLYYRVYDYGVSMGKWAEVVNPANSASPSYSGYTKPTGIITVPDSITYNGQKIRVSWIGQRAFESCNGITRVVLNHQVAILSNAFKNCTGLTSVMGMCDVSQLSNGAFLGCNSLHIVTIGNSIDNIPTNTFYNCTSLDTIFMSPQNPPSLGSNSIPTGVIIMLSGCAYENYYNATDWINHRPNLRDPEIELTIVAQTNDSAMGVANILPLRGNMVRCDSTAIVECFPLYGYHFTQWNNGSISNPDTLHLWGDSIITAFLAPDTFCVKAFANSNERGDVIINDTLVVYKDSVDMTAAAYYGYRFDHWLDYDSVFYNYSSPTYINSNESDTNVSRRICITHKRFCMAVFVPLTYNLTLNVDSSSHGWVNGDGYFDYYSERVIYAHANQGYHFDYWNDGSTENPRTITLTQDTSFTAFFSVNQYTIELYNNNEDMGTIDGGGTYSYLDTSTLTATPIEHHHFLNWMYQGEYCYILSSDNPLYYAVTQDNLFVAYFAIDTHAVSVASDDITRGCVEGGGEFEYGTPCTISAEAYSGYHFSHWSNGATYNPYTFAVTEDTELTAVFLSDGEVGIESVDNNGIAIYVEQGRVVVYGSRDKVLIYDIAGRTVRNEALPAGVYIVKVGNHNARKVVIIK